MPIVKKSDAEKAKRDPYAAMRRMVLALRRGDKSDLQAVCLRSKVKALNAWGESLRSLDGVVLESGTSTVLSKKPAAALLGMISILRDEGRLRAVRFMEKALRNWIRQTPRDQWSQFVIHPVTRQIAVRLRVADNVGAFSRVKQMGLGHVQTKRGRGVLLSAKDAEFEVKLDDGSITTVSRAGFYFHALPF